VQKLQFNQTEELTDLYPLLSSDHRAVQGAAYGILHRSLPSVQEALSIEVVFSKTTQSLPEELLSLLLDPPSMSLFDDIRSSTDAIWIDVRRYLLSWKVVFDHFSRASHALREAYVVSIKDNGHVEYLLNFTCDILRIGAGTPVDASKFDISTFNLDEESSLAKECQWLTINLYYCSLLYLPTLTKSWWIEQKNRIKIPLESWSQKHICPLIISASFTTVTDWLATQNDPSNPNSDVTSDSHPLSLKLNPRTSEITASIPVDPDSPPISLYITLPPSYPFANATVTSHTRVAISEQKWQSWLLTIQALITFTPGAGVVDGLTAFRRNVQAALRGQSECAICYSVVGGVGADMRTPDKRCGTCKNVFHGGCLFRWFRSSGSSSCPLCRNPFSYA
jgi:E3 ubiquitin-protein ligase listerin